MPGEDMTREFVHDVVTYHATTEDQLAAITAIRNATEEMIWTITKNCPNCADKHAAIRWARTAMMTANAAIVLDGKV